MDNELRQVLEGVREGRLTVDEAAVRLRSEPFRDIGYAKVDLHRKTRQGAAEVIYGAGKTPEQIAGIADVMVERGQGPILITRLAEEAAAAVAKTHPLDYHRAARVGIIGQLPPPGGLGTVVVATGGTSDIPVAEEAALTAQALGNRVERLYDVGVAGLHRTLAHLDEIMGASVIIAIAGMEGAGQRNRRAGGLPGDRRPHQRGIWGVLPRPVRPAVYAQLLRQRGVGGEH